VIATRQAGASPPRCARLPLGRAERLVPAAAILLGVGYWGVTTWLEVAQTAAFHRYLHDFALYVNILWNTAHGRPFATTLLRNDASHLAEHVALGLLPLTPLYALDPDPRLLIALQQGALALAGAPIYLLAHRRLGGAWPPLLLLAAFYLAPNLSEAVISRAFYPVALTTVPLGFGTYWLLTGRTRRGVALALAAPLIEETSALTVFGLGLLLLLRRQLRPGLLLCGVAAAWLTLVSLAIMPAFHRDQPLPTTGNRVVDKFNGLQTPLGAWNRLSERAPRNLSWLLLPTGGLALLAPQTLVAGLPTTAVLLLTDGDDVQSHRIAPVIPMLWLATVEGLALLRAGWRRTAALALVLALAVLTFRDRSWLPGGGAFDPDLATRDALTAAMERALAVVPTEASVGATSNALIPLADRREVYTVPEVYPPGLGPRQRLEWYVLDVTRDDYRKAIGAPDDPSSPLNARPPYALWLLDDQVLVASDRPEQVDHAMAVEFGGAMRLEGYTIQPTAAGVSVRLRWQALKRLPRGFVRRLEALSADGAVLATLDGPATRSYYPTSRWPSGQIVVEDISVEPGVGRQAVRYRLSWLDPKAGAVLRLPDGRDALLLDAAS